MILNRFLICNQFEHGIFFDECVVVQQFKCHKLERPVPFEATEEELVKAKSNGKTNTESQGKKNRPVATPARNSRATDQETEPGSGNPAKLKRHRSKLPDPDKDRQIAELQKAGLLMILIVHDRVPLFHGGPYVHRLT